MAIGGLTRVVGEHASVMAVVSAFSAYRASSVFAFLKDESGATAIEYGLIAAGISVVINATVNAIGTTLNAKFDSVSTQLK